MSRGTGTATLAVVSCRDRPQDVVGDPGRRGVEAVEVDVRRLIEVVDELEPDPVSGRDDHRRPGEDAVVGLPDHLVAADRERAFADGQGRGELAVAAAKLARLRERLVLGDVERRPVGPGRLALVLLAEAEAAGERDRARERHVIGISLCAAPGRGRNTSGSGADRGDERLELAADVGAGGLVDDLGHASVGELGGPGAKRRRGPVKLSASTIVPGAGLPGRLVDRVQARPCAASWTPRWRSPPAPASITASHSAHRRAARVMSASSS